MENLEKASNSLSEDEELEIYFNPKTKEDKYLFVKDKNGKILEFTDLRNSSQYKNIIKEVYAERGIALTEKELDVISKIQLEDDFDKMLDELDKKNKKDN